MNQTKRAPSKDSEQTSLKGRTLLGFSEGLAGLMVVGAGIAVKPPWYAILMLLFGLVATFGVTELGRYLTERHLGQ